MASFVVNFDLYNLQNNIIIWQRIDIKHLKLKVESSNKVVFYVGIDHLYSRSKIVCVFSIKYSNDSIIICIYFTFNCVEFLKFSLRKHSMSDASAYFPVCSRMRLMPKSSYLYFDTS